MSEEEPQDAAVGLRVSRRFRICPQEWGLKRVEFEPGYTQKVLAFPMIMTAAGRLENPAMPSKEEPE